jgi:hypothetical protein
MKKLLVALAIVVLAVIVLVQAIRLNRLSPAENYEYGFREDIDLDYHDPAAVMAYFDTGYEVGSFAREMWKNRGINVWVPESDDISNKVAVLRYNHLRAYADSLGMRLARSKQYKAQGLNNADIRLIEDEGVSMQDIQIHKRFGKSEMRLGERSDAVFALQGLLIGKGYTMPHDGYFWTETEASIRDFQSKNSLFASGVADKATLQALIK